ncbi:Olfactory receptor 1F12 [Plecturocebus cupreus]
MVSNCFNIRSSKLCSCCAFQTTATYRKACKDLRRGRIKQPPTAGLFGNLLILLAIGSDHGLHTPMYFFLANLSLVDLCLPSATVPKMLLNIETQTQTISYPGCLAQMYFCMMFANMDNFLLTVMAYDRYVAICHPLHYSTIMTPHLCASLIAVPWVIAILNPLLHTLMMAHLHFCSDNVIHHFFCDINSLLPLSCSDTSLNQLNVLATTHKSLWTETLKDSAAPSFHRKCPIGISRVREENS